MEMQFIPPMPDPRIQAVPTILHLLEARKKEEDAYSEKIIEMMIEGLMEDFLPPEQVVIPETKDNVVYVDFNKEDRWEDE